VKEAMLYERLPNRQVRCHLCSHECLIDEGKPGSCLVRQNEEGTLYSLVYGQAIAQHVDPMEKKPLYHFLPGTQAYSIATPGCNFRCLWCQNSGISQTPRQRTAAAAPVTHPADVVRDAQASECPTIAYTYTEPTIFAEYAYDIARQADARGIHNVMVSNGYMTEQMLETFHPYLDAVNVDLKAFRDQTYRHYMGGRLQPVLDNLKTMKRLGIWVEVTMLIIPGLNDDPGELRGAAQFIVDQLGPQTPWHLSRFHPAYRMSDIPPTPMATLQLARAIGREVGLRYVYLGNVAGGTDTTCHQCHRQLLRRSTWGVAENRITGEGRCPDCHTPVAGVGMGGAAVPTSSG
jgi:pyruvate formate lyase activating enzyme